MILSYNFIDGINNESINRLIHYVKSAENSVDCLKLNISSLGGSVASAITIYNFLKSVPFKVNTHNLGEVTSAAIYQLQELVQLLDADIENYASIVNQETNCLRGLYDLKECLRGKSITLYPESAFKCGIITKMCE